MTKVTCQQEATFPALLRPLQAAPPPCSEDGGSVTTWEMPENGRVLPAAHRLFTLSEMLFINHQTSEDLVINKE